jgi:transcriptional regulator with XRE-family HTH domain
MELKIFQYLNRLSRKDISSLLGISTTYYSLIVNGHYYPSKKLMIKIIDLTKGKIDINTFYKKELDKWKKSSSPIPNTNGEVV